MKLNGQRIGDAPIESKYQQKMNTIAKVLDEFLNGTAHGKDRTTGFVLLVFPFGSDDRRCNYISNSEREDVVVLLKEQLARLSGQPELKGRA